MVNKFVYGIGVMSGTSLDGLDLVYIKFDKDDISQFKIEKAITYPYSIEWKNKLKEAFHYSKNELVDLDIVYGNFIGDRVNQFIKDYCLTKVDYIASHGHTIFHNPANGVTLQIGNGKEIAKRTNVKVICDFRTQDVALGGQGAPLVPIGDEILFNQFGFCLNLGGFANISFKTKGKRIAYDICPVNTVLNYYVSSLGLDYDNKGEIASTGHLNYQLLEKLNGLSFYKLSYPKSLGYEFVIEEIIPLIDSFNLSIEDILRTFIEHIAIQITNQLSVKKNKEILITGGGAYNRFLIKRLQSLLGYFIQLPSDLLINYKESLIFALLGLLKIRNQVNCLKSVTGAKKDHCSGVIFNP